MAVTIALAPRRNEVQGIHKAQPRNTKEMVLRLNQEAVKKSERKKAVQKAVATSGDIQTISLMIC